MTTHTATSLRARSFKLATLTTIALSPFLAQPSRAFADTITPTYLAPGVQTPIGTNSYETFTTVNGQPFNGTTNFNGSNVTGVFTGGYSILNADQYGGAGGTGQYIGITAGNSATLNLSSGVHYLGLWVSALDGGNELKFYNNGTLVLDYTAASFLSGLNLSCPGGSAYCGNPNSGADAHEPYAYVNFADDGTFNQVVLSESGQNQTFELDNFAVAQVAPVTNTPEPSSLVLLGSGCIAAAGAFRRRLAK